MERIRTERDPIVKDILTKKFIATRRNYEKWSDGKIDTKFWERMGTKGYELLKQEYQQMAQAH
jgi:predicted ribonuclease toxin of YeeF-YezG toxin-antitoxin module